MDTLEWGDDIFNENSRNRTLAEVPNCVVKMVMIYDDTPQFHVKNTHFYEELSIYITRSKKDSLTFRI